MNTRIPVLALRPTFKNNQVADMKLINSHGLHHLVAALNRGVTATNQVFVAQK